MSDFKDRLEQACKQAGVVPEKNKGQQIYLAQQVGVSQEAVRKWFAGLSTPRASVMRKLAAALSVDYFWLALGEDPERGRRRRAMSEKEDAAVYALTGFLISKGFKVAFPDLELGYDINAVGHNELLQIVVGVAEPGEGVYSFKASLADSRSLTPLIAVPYSEGFGYTFLNVPPSVLRAGEVTGARTTVSIERRGDDYFSGGEALSRFLS